MVLLAFYRTEKELNYFWQEDLGEGRLEVKVEGTPTIEDNKLVVKVKVEGGDFPELYSKSALLNLYGALDIPYKSFSLWGRVRLKEGRVFISASYKDIEGITPKPFSLRERILERAKEKVEDPEVRGLVLSYLFGQAQDHLSFEVQRAFGSTGLVHLLVVSGSHLATLFFLLRWLAPYPHGLFFALAGVSFYTFFVVPKDPPVLRAFLMLSLAVLTKLFEGLPNLLSILLFSGSLILLAYPEYVYSYSFWLSFCATLYIILSLREAPEFSDNHYVKAFLLSFWVSLFAFLGTAPLILSFSYSTPNSVLFTPFVSLAFVPFTLYGFLNILSFFSLPSFPLELSGKLALWSVKLFSGFDWQLQKGMSLTWSAFLITLNAFLLYFAKGYQKLLALMIFVLFYLFA